MSLAALGAYGALAPLAFDLFPLEIFPESGLGRSIVTTVLIGLVIMVIMNEMFGWVLSGVVVPGYLAPILLIQPWSGAVIIAEAIATHGLVILVGQIMPRLGLWRELFGRDRFFAYLLFGTIVRMVTEGFLVDPFGRLLNDAFGLAIDYRNSFYSVGLIVVPLLANTFFKPGFKRGWIPVAASVGLCYLAIRFLLLPLTNYSISSFELAYGYYATDFFGNAKAYIILLTTAYLASRNNLLYGWDYNGILIPSLVALAWFEPIKVATTVVEAVLILVSARWVASRPFLQDVTIEAGRKLLLTFSIGFVWKLASGYVLGALDPGFDATSLYGFGYLLPSLIAGKMWQKGSVGLVLRPMLQTSLAGAIIGSVAAKLLALGMPVEPPGPLAPGPAGPDGVIEREEPDLDVLVRLDAIRIVGPDDRKGYDRIYDRELVALSEACRHLLAAQREQPGSSAARGHVARADELARPTGYEVLHVKSPADRAGVYYLRESADGPGRLRGWGIYAFAARPSSDLVLEVPRPLAEPLALELGAALFAQLGARALLIAGAHPDASADGAADVLRAPRSLFAAVDALCAPFDVAQVRTAPPPAADADTGGRRAARSIAPDELFVYVESVWPPSLDRAALTGVLGRSPRVVLPAEARFEAANRQRDMQLRPFATIVLGERAARRALERRREAVYVPVEVHADGIDGFLRARLLDDPLALAATGSGSYRVPTLPELAALSAYVYAPLARLQREAERGVDPDPGLRELAPMARRLGLELATCRHARTGERFAVLYEPAPLSGQIRRRHWGLLALRLGPARAFAVEVPHPLTEAYTLDSGLALLRLLDARALLVAGASRHANLDGSADVTDLRNLGSAFQLGHQALLRESRGETLTVSVRGFASHQDPDLDVVISTGQEVKAWSHIPSSVAELGHALALLDARVSYYDGSRLLFRFEGKHTAQWAYADAQYPGQFVHCWLSRDVRESLGGRLAFRPWPATPDLGLVRRTGSLVAFVAQALAASPGAPGDAAPDAAADADREAWEAKVLEALTRHAETHHVGHLAIAEEAARRAGGELWHLVDPAQARGYVAFRPRPGGRMVAVVQPPGASLPAGPGEAPGAERILYASDPALYDRLVELARDGRDRVVVLRGAASPEDPR